MLQELQNFGTELNCSSEVENCTKFPPNTLVAYWAVVKEFLNDFNAFIIQIETEVKKQSKYCLECFGLHYSLSFSCKRNYSIF